MFTKTASRSIRTQIVTFMEDWAEYTLILALIAVLCVGAVLLLSGQLTALLAPR